ncbi:hypothetical protein SSX86_026976 [Deinandra increscens subsp. villosa]|uniref:RRM domain-containing protein n=1 Tax=Deinandra increscens subsp. villosa TaxID=3103831 RepID=A0AAP0GPQ1_9ASTR
MVMEQVGMTDGQRSIEEEPGESYGGEEVSFFISDLPNGCTGRYLWDTFRNMGRISDAFVPGRKDWRGRYFGFIRFREVADVDGMLQRLRGVRVDGARVRVFISKFKRVIGWEVRRRDGNGWNKRAARRCVFLSEKPGLYQKHCEGRSLIGEVHYLELLEDVRERIVFLGHENVAISYIGGVKLLLTFKEGHIARRFLYDQKDGWGRIFTSLKWWDGASQETERIVCLRIMGVPIMIRDDSTFDKIGEMFGRRVNSSDFSWALDDNSVGRVCVATKELRWIDEMVDIVWNHMRFSVWVREDSELMESAGVKRSSKEGKTGGDNCGSQEEDGVLAGWKMAVGETGGGKGVGAADGQGWSNS